MWKEDLPQRRHMVWLFECLLPKLVVPLVMFVVYWFSRGKQKKVCGFQVDRCTSKAYERRGGRSRRRAARKWRILHCVYIICAVPTKENEKFFWWSKARNQCSSIILWSGTHNICDRNPILLRCYAEWNSAMRVEELSGGWMAFSDPPAVSMVGKQNVGYGCM